MRLKLPPRLDPEGFRRHLRDDVWREAAAVVCARHGIPHSTLRRSPQGENVIFFAGERHVVKLYGPFRDGYRREAAALEFVHGRLGVKTPEVLHRGELEGSPYVVMTRLPGLLLREVWHGVEAENQLEIVARLGVTMKELHALGPPPARHAPEGGWQGFIGRQARSCLERQRACGANPEWLERLPGFLDERITLLPSDNDSDHVLLHGDVHPGNILLAERGGRWRVTGLFDFADSLCGFHEYEFVAPGVLLVQGRREQQRAMLLAYGYAEHRLDRNLRARLMLLTALYECSDLRKYALRLAPEAVHLTLEELEAAIWTFAKD